MGQVGPGLNENINYKVITTDLKSNDKEILKIPFWLLGVDDLAQLLDVSEYSQLAIIDKALKLVGYFCRNNETILKQKNEGRKTTFIYIKNQPYKI